MVPKYMEKIAERNHSKVMLFDIGNDIWGDANHPDLKSKIEKWVKSFEHRTPGINRK